ncbi:hypothetical protein Fcan01_10733 [Folsomia candida]|uniref:Uncharacterized protein n=1 Tax=Folsomia candida TaxID=158441 RepID=A0A226ED96_FOLCA|nr:hypothetical protein Fcan01_10733 [Folsomia candida]
MKLALPSERFSFDPEELLLKWAKWPIFGVQFNGYFVLSITPRKLQSDIESQEKKGKKSLQFNFFSIPFIFHLLFLIIFSILLIWWGNEGFGSFNRLQKLSSDATILTGYIICGFVYTIGGRIWGFVSVKQNLAFWTYQVDKVALITPNLWDPETVSDLQKKIRTSFTRTVYLLCTVLIMLFFNNVILVDILQISKPSIISDSIVTKNGPVLITRLLWVYSYFSFVFFSIWLNFFVKLYAAAVSSIRIELEGVKISGARITRLSKTYGVLIKSVDHFNEEMGGRIFLEVGFNLIVMLCSTYFVIVSAKLGEIGSILMNLIGALLSVHVLYVYGNDGENLEVARAKLANLLCEIEEWEVPWEMGGANKV